MDDQDLFQAPLGQWVLAPLAALSKTHLDQEPVGQHMQHSNG